MKKEVILAVVAGLILGLIITMGIYTANRSVNQMRAKKQLQSAPTPSLLPAANGNKTINLTSHETFDLLEDENEINLSGVAWPNAIIALISETDSQLLRADKEGVFMVKARLVKGFNEIKLIGTDENGNTITQNLVLTYTTNTILPLEASLFPVVKLALAAETSDTATEDATVTDKIKERLQDTAEEGLVSIKESLTEKSTAPRKKAYVGNISAMDENSLTLTYKDQNFSVNTGPKTIYVKGANTALDRANLTIDNFIIAMGWYEPAAGTFTAVRISQIAAPQPPANRQLVTGKIAELDGQKISLNGRNLTVSKKTEMAVAGLDKAAIEDLALGDNLFAIVTLDNNGDIDSTDDLYIIPGKNNPAGLTPTNINATNSGQASPSAEDAD